MNKYVIPAIDLGIRSGWAKRPEPLPFNVIVNSMKDVMRHEDKGLIGLKDFGLQSSCAGTFRENIPHMKKGL